MLVPIFVKERLYIPRAPEFEDILDELRVKFTHKNPNFAVMKAMGKWTGNIQPQIRTWMHVTTKEWGDCLSLPRGGTNRVRQVFKHYNVKPRFMDRRLSLPPITYLHNDVVLRPDQERLAKAMFKRENCLIRSPTASGKTETALKVAEWILKTAGPVLVMVWETELMRQWIERTMLRFGLREQDIGILGGGKKRIAPITIGMQQTLMKQGYRHAHQFGGIIADEVQRFAAPTFQKVIDIFPARYRLGISADESRKDKKQFLIYDAFGEVADEIEKSQLIEEGKIHDVSIRLVPTNFNCGIELSSKFIEWAKLPGALKDWKDFIDEMDDDEERNDRIWEFMEPCFKSGNICLIITRRRAAAKYWNDRIHTAGYSSGFLIGGNATEFHRTVNGLRRRTIQAGVGTIQKSGVGHDIKQLDRGFIINPLAKNEQLFEQVIGRLRRTCDDKQDAVLYYFWDKYCYPNDRRTICKNYPNTYLWVDDEFLSVAS